MSEVQLDRPPVLPHLRQTTAQAHTSLEHTVSIHSRLQDPQAYQHLLQKFLGFYHPLEQALLQLDGWKAWDIAMDQRLKSPWLRQDLAVLGLNQTQIESLPLCPDLPEIITLAQGFGVAYVLEGSTLGSRQILQLLQKSSIPPQACRFFRGHGEQIIPMWKTFCRGLEQFHQSSPDDDTEQTLTTANQTFECLERWMATPTS